MKSFFLLKQMNVISFSKCALEAVYSVQEVLVLAIMDANTRGNRQMEGETRNHVLSLLKSFHLGQQLCIAGANCVD